MSGACFTHSQGTGDFLFTLGPFGLETVWKLVLLSLEPTLQCNTGWGWGRPAPPGAPVRSSCGRARLPRGEETDTSQSCSKQSAPVVPSRGGHDLSEPRGPASCLLPLLLCLSESASLVNEFISHHFGAVCIEKLIILEEVLCE